MSRKNNKIPEKYHSALSDQIEGLTELDEYSSDGNYVFKHDVLNGYSDRFKCAEAIYSEISWRDGFEKFMKRANKNTTNTFKDYMNGVIDIVKTLKVPTFITAGKHHFSYLKKITPIYQPITLHGTECFIAIAYYSPLVDEFSGMTNYQVTDKITKNFDNILDFSCGYGNTAEFAIRNNKNFICSDVNGKCVRYVAKKYMNYKERNV